MEPNSSTARLEPNGRLTVWTSCQGAFNIRDGLDDYDDDYTTYKSLGKTITAEMRHRAEDLLRRQVKAGEQAVDEPSNTDAEEDESVAVESNDRGRRGSLDEKDEPGASDSEEERKNDA